MKDKVVEKMQEEERRKGKDEGGEGGGRWREDTGERRA